MWQPLYQNRELFLSRAMLRKYLHEIEGVKGLKKVDSFTRTLNASDTTQLVLQLFPSISHVNKAKLYKLLYILLRHSCLAKRLTRAACPQFIGEKEVFSPHFKADSTDYCFLSQVRHGEIPYEELISVRLLGCV